MSIDAINIITTTDFNDTEKALITQNDTTVRRASIKDMVLRHTVDDLTTGGINKNLSAEQGKILDSKITSTSNKIGDLSTLTTTDKTSIVNSIKEINADLSENTQQISEHTSFVTNEKDFLTRVTSPRPPKQGVNTCSPKIVRKVSDNEWYVLQYQGESGAYLQYKLTANIGGTTDSVGGSWELLRLKKVELFCDAYVWYYAEPTEGALTVLHSPTQVSNTPETLFVEPVINDLTTANTISSLTNNVGLSTYTIPYSTTYTWDINQTASNKVGLTFLTSSGSSDNVSIVVNGITVKTINLQMKPTNSTNGLYTVDVEIAKSSNYSASQKVQIQIINSSVTLNCYFVAFNLCKLKDWNYQVINNFKALGTNKVYIDADGASDYAIYDLDISKWCGSYHGGETREYGKIYGHMPTGIETINYTPYGTRHKHFEMIDCLNNWCVMKSLKMYQKTDINSKAKMITNYDFDVDGTLEMEFSLRECTINTTNFYTALTCTKPEFTYVTYPHILEVTLNGDTPMPLSEGVVTQYDTSNLLEMNIRFTKFNDYYNTKHPFMRNNTYYSKFYYGVVNEYASGINIPNLTFSKGLDFGIRKLT